MTPAFAQSPVGFLYKTTDVLFPGYAPEASFDHMVDVVVARIPASAPYGYTCVLSESRAPAQFFSARCTSDEESSLKLDTGSGTSYAVLLNSLCRALADGSASFYEPETPATWALRKKFPLTPDGCNTEVYTSASGARVEIDDQSDGLGGHTDAMTLYVTDTPLALDIAKAMSEGMLGVKFGR